MSLRGWLVAVLGGLQIAAVVATGLAGRDSLRPLDLPSAEAESSATMAAASAPVPAHAVSTHHRSSAQDPKAMAYPHGWVMDSDGGPVAGLRVVETATQRSAMTDVHGSFPCGVIRGRWAVAGTAHWLPIHSPLLDVCQLKNGVRLVVAATEHCDIRVVDGDGRAVDDARVAVALDVSFADRPTADLPTSVVLSDLQTATSVGNGWYALPRCPTSKGARVVVAREGFVTAVVSSESRQTVVLNPRSQADPSSPGPLISRAVTTQVDGWLRDANHEPRAGWWIAAVADRATEHVDSLLSRFVAPPIKVGADGRFAFSGLPQGNYRFEAWHPQNKGVVRSNLVRAPAAGVELHLGECTMQDKVRGRLVDEQGEPLQNVTIGLGRATGWAARGPLAMHADAITATDRNGQFELATRGRHSLALHVCGPSVVPCRIAIPNKGHPSPVVVRAVRRIWLSVPTDGDRQLAGLTVKAIDASGSPLPLWAGDARPARSLAMGQVSQFGFAQSAKALVWTRGEREVARFQYAPRRANESDRFAVLAQELR